MYAPLLIAGLLASGAGTGMQIAGNQEAKSALNATRSQEQVQQAGFQKSAQSQVANSLAQSTAPVAQKQMETGANNRMSAFQALQAAGAPLTGQPTQSTTTNKVIGGTPTEQAAARSSNAGNAWSDLQARAQANEGGYGDWQTAQNVKNATTMGNLSAIGTQASDAASIYPLEQNVALQKGDSLGGWGQLLSALGSLSMMGAAVSAPPAAAASAGGNQALSIVKSPNLWTDIAGYGLPK
jgi:hypothetical protein